MNFGGRSFYLYFKGWRPCLLRICGGQCRPGYRGWGCSWRQSSQIDSWCCWGWIRLRFFVRASRGAFWWLWGWWAHLIIIRVVRHLQLIALLKFLSWSFRRWYSPDWRSLYLEVSFFPPSLGLGWGLVLCGWVMCLLECCRAFGLFALTFFTCNFPS